MHRKTEEEEEMEMLQQSRSTPLPGGSARSATRWRRVTAVAAAIAGALAAWLLIEVAFGVDLQAPVFQGSGQGFDIGPTEVLLTSGLAAFAAWALLSLVERWARRPGRIWRWTAIGAFVMSLSGPMSGGGIPASHRWLLALLHVVVAIVLIPLLSRTTES